MVCFHKRYDLGDKHDFTPESIKKFVQRDDVVSLPLYLYDHSGITMRTSPFSCPWDSGQVGFIYVTHARIKAEMGRPKGVNNFTGIKHVMKKDIERAERALLSEVKIYDNYLTGEVYGYMVEDDEENHIDSCWGFYGDEGKKYMIEEAKQIVDHQRTVPNYQI